MHVLQKYEPNLTVNVKDDQPILILTNINMLNIVWLLFKDLPFCHILLHVDSAPPIKVKGYGL